MHNHQFAPTQERVFHFTKDSITKLKAKANGEVGTGRISSLQALLSHVCQSVSRVKHLDPEREVNFKLSIGCRPRFQSLPEEYFGVAIQTASVTLSAKQLAEHGLGETAWKMNRMIDAYTEEKLREISESWSRSPKLITLSAVMGNVLLISSSPRFNVYGPDFGWGKPIAVRSGPANKTD